MSKLSDLAPSVFSANEGQPHHLLFLGCKSPVCRTHRNRCPTWQPLENIPAVLYVKNVETCSLKKNKEPALCCFLKWASFISVYLTFLEFCCGSVCDLHSRPHSPTVPRGLLGQRSLATTMGMNGRLAVRKDRRGSSCRGDQNINSAAPHPVLLSLNCTPQDFF